MSVGEKKNWRKVTLGLAHRYGIVTVRMLVWLGMSQKNAERIIAAFVREGRLQGFPIGITLQKYYMLTPRSAAVLGLDAEKYAYPFGPLALPAHVAIAWWCIKAMTPRLLREEFEAKLAPIAIPKILDRAARTRYVIDKSTGTERLCLLEVDGGSPPRRLARKARRHIQTRRDESIDYAEKNDVPEVFVSQFLDHGLFCVKVLVAHEPKAERLRHIVARDPVEITVDVVPEYGELLGGKAK